VVTEKFIKSGMKAVAKLYDCEARCIGYFLTLFSSRLDFTDEELITLFDRNKVCLNGCIKELLKEFHPKVYLEVRDFCVKVGGK
jgi:hypothetical protein